jgi:hypothetical protein
MMSTWFTWDATATKTGKRRTLTCRPHKTHKKTHYVRHDKQPEGGKEREGKEGERQETDRETHRDTHTHTHRERERERERYLGLHPQWPQISVCWQFTPLGHKTLVGQGKRLKGRDFQETLLISLLVPFIHHSSNPVSNLMGARGIMLPYLWCKKGARDADNKEWLRHLKAGLVLLDGLRASGMFANTCSRVPLRLACSISLEVHQVLSLHAKQDGALRLT